MRTALICHEGSAFDQAALAQWLGSFSDLAGIMIIREPPSRFWQRVRRELRRTGLFGLADVLAYRLWHRWRWAQRDRADEDRLVGEITSYYPPLKSAVPMKIVSSPNSAEAREFLRSLRPDVVVARCKTLLKPEIFKIAEKGTFAFHPGICPEYRNAHGCFWALAQGDFDNVGMTLLQIDEGVDTGPIYGQFRLHVNSLAQSTSIIQQRAVFDHLPALRSALENFVKGRAEPLDVRGRPSAVWGQPRLTAYWRLCTHLQKRRDPLS
jgi:hypothetical protein